MQVLRLMLKIMCALILLMMTVGISGFSFLLALSTTLLGILSGLMAFVGMLMLFTEALSTVNGIIFLAVAWLISPMGLPAAAEWLLSFLAKLREAIWEKVF